MSPAPLEHHYPPTCLPERLSEVGKTLRDFRDEWDRQPPCGSTSIARAAWSFKQLSNDSLSSRARVLHQLNLALVCETVRLPKASICREIKAHSKDLERPSQGRRIDKQFGRYVSRGEMYRTVAEACIGLLLHPCPSMSTKALHHLCHQIKTTERPWTLGVDLLDDAQTFSKVVRSLCVARKIELPNIRRPRPIPPISVPDSVERRLGSESSSTCLFWLLVALGGRVPDWILHQALRPQRRWGADGMPCTISRHEAGLVPPFSELFESRSCITTALNYCIGQELIITSTGNAGVEYVVRRNPTEPIPEAMMSQAIAFVSYIFPRDEELDSSFWSLARQLRGLLDHLLREPPPSRSSRLTTLPTDVRRCLAEACLALSRLNSKSEAEIGIGEALLTSESPDDLRILIAHRKSQVLRLKGDYAGSDASITPLLPKSADDVAAATDRRTYCALGRLIMSRVENSLQQGQRSRAEHYLQMWSNPERFASGLELHVLRMKNVVFARAHRYDGDFAHAQECLAKCLSPSETSETASARAHIKFHLGDVLCELNREEEVPALVRKDMAKFKARGLSDSPAYRRLSLALAEAHLKRGQLAAAAQILIRLDQTWSAQTELHVSDQLCHYRAMIGIIRIQQSRGDWESALQTAVRAKRLTERYTTFEPKGYYHGLLYMFSSLSLRVLGRQKDCAVAQDLARGCNQQVRHYIPGLGTYVRESLLKTLGCASQQRKCSAD